VQKNRNSVSAESEFLEEGQKQNFWKGQNFCQRSSKREESGGMRLEGGGVREDCVGVSRELGRNKIYFGFPP